MFAQYFELLCNQDSTHSFKEEPWVHFSFCLFRQSDVLMPEKMETMDASDGHASASSAKKNGQTSLLDSGEDFEVLNEEDIDDDDPPPPLEDAGGGKAKTTDDTVKRNADEDPDPPGQVDEWLDVLGMRKFFIIGQIVAQFFLLEGLE